MIIQFNVDKTFLKELDIDNLGEFAIEARRENKKCKKDGLDN